MVNLKLLCVCLIVYLYIPNTESNDIYDSVKQGFTKVGQKIHCYSHTLKNVVYAHEHQPGENPCHQSQPSTTPRVDDNYYQTSNPDAEIINRK